AVFVIRSGSVISMRCVAEVKYFSKGCLLIVIAPWPGRKRTRATACLRRPVVWLSGTGMGWFCVLPGSAGPLGFGQVERFWLLCGVRVFWPGVDVELAELLAPQGVLREHAAHRASDELGRLF